MEPVLGDSFNPVPVFVSVYHRTKLLGGKTRADMLRAMGQLCKATSVKLDRLR